MAAVHGEVMNDPSGLIPIHDQDDTNSLVCRASGCVARQSQITADMLLPRALPDTRHPARLSIILIAKWN